MKYGENLIITGAFECLCLVYLITPAALRSLTRFTTPRYQLSVVPFLNFVLTSLPLRSFGLLYATSGGLLNIIANRSFD